MYQRGKKLVKASSGNTIREQFLADAVSIKASMRLTTLSRVSIRAMGPSCAAAMTSLRELLFCISGNLSSLLVGLLSEPNWLQGRAGLPYISAHCPAKFVWRVSRTDCLGKTSHGNPSRHLLCIRRQTTVCRGDRDAGRSARCASLHSHVGFVAFCIPDYVSTLIHGPD